MAHMSAGPRERPPGTRPPAQPLDAPAARRVADLFETLADPSRARILHLLATADGEPRVQEIADGIGMSVSAVSHQLRFLRERGAVDRRPAGRSVHYRLVDDHLRELVLGAVAHVAEPGP